MWHAQNCTVVNYDYRHHYLDFAKTPPVFFFIINTRKTYWNEEPPFRFFDFLVLSACWYSMGWMPLDDAIFCSSSSNMDVEQVLLKSVQKKVTEINTTSMLMKWVGKRKISRKQQNWMQFQFVLQIQKANWIWRIDFRVAAKDWNHNHIILFI